MNSARSVVRTNGLSISPSAVRGTQGDRAKRVLAGSLIAALILVAYRNVYSVPFLFDDFAAIVENPHIHQIWPPTWLTATKPQTPLTGRPIAALTFALNWKLAGGNPTSYHAVSVAIHSICAWLLFRIVELMLLSVYGESRSTNHVLAVSALIAGLWALHPIQSEAVTYITQRTELLMTLFYLLTIYCSIRACQSGDHWQWVLAVVVSASLGMGCKESMATAPIVVLVLLKLLDGGSFRSIISKNRRLMCALVFSELILVGLMARGGRSETAGLATGIGSVDYLLIQCRVVLGYFRLCAWPHPLVFDYGPARDSSMQEAWPFVAAMLVIVSMIAVLTVKKPRVGWLLALSLLVLTPTSSIVPISSEIGAERRMYLPLAFLLGAIIPAISRRISINGGRTLRIIGASTAAGVVIACILVTVNRIADYQSAERIWTNSLVAEPDNWRAHFNLGFIHDEAGRVEDSLIRFREAIRIEPRAYKAHTNLGSALYKLGRIGESIEAYNRSLSINEQFDQTHFNLAVALQSAGRTEESIREYETALKLNNQYTDAHYNLAALLQTLGKLADAEKHYRSAISLRPDHADAYNNLGNVLGLQGRLTEAAWCFEKALAFDPSMTEAADNLRGIRAVMAGKTGGATNASP